MQLISKVVDYPYGRKLRYFLMSTGEGEHVTKQYGDFVGIFPMGMGVAFTLAQFSTNNISMLLKLILLVVIAVALLPKIIISAFYFYNSLYQWTRILMIELIATVVLLLLGMSLCALGMVGQQKKDLLTV